MVLESLITSKEAERSPGELFWYGILYSSVAIILGLWIFRDQASLVMVFLTVLAVIPLIFSTMKREERKTEVDHSESHLLKSHGRVLWYFMALFLGMVVSFAVWYVFLPQAQVDSLFSTQISTIKSINSNFFRAIPLEGHFSNESIFVKILSNNIKVMLFCLFFSFFYGAGAIFILTWNASVIAGAAGSYIRSALASTASSFGLQSIAVYFGAFSVGIMRYLTHGSFEILAYFIGGLAGGIISVAVIRHELYARNLQRVFRDVAALMVVAMILLVAGAIVEVYITPQIF